MEILQRIKHRENPLLCIYLKKTKTLISKDIYTPMFIAALFITAQIWRQLKCPSVNEWIKNLLHTHTEYDSAIKKE